MNFTWYDTTALSICAASVEVIKVPVDHFSFTFSTTLTECGLH